MALWEFFAIFASVLAVVIAVFVGVLLVWSRRDAPNYWREQDDTTMS